MPGIDFIGQSAEMENNWHEFSTKKDKDPVTPEKMNSFLS